MRRGWKIALLLVVLAIVVGVVWLAQDVKFELRVQEYDDQAVDIQLIPPLEPEVTDDAVSASEPSPMLNGVLGALGLGFLGLCLAAVVFTALAVVKQVRLIRRGRSDSR